MTGNEDSALPLSHIQSHQPVGRLERKLAGHVCKDGFFGSDAAFEVFVGERESCDDFEFIASKLVEQVA